MIPNTLNLPTIWRGCDWGPITLKWKDANGLPLDLRVTNSGFWQARAQSLNIFLTVVFTNRQQGIMKMSLTKGETALFRLGVEKWDWIWEHVNHQGIVDYRFSPFLAGKLSIKDPVTKAGVDPLGPDSPLEMPEGAVTPDPPEILDPIESTEVTHDPPIP